MLYACLFNAACELPPFVATTATAAMELRERRAQELGLGGHVRQAGYGRDAGTYADTVVKPP